MRIHRTAALTVAGITGVLGLAAPARAETPDTFYVNAGTGSGCSDAGTGTEAQPFCTIGAAAAVVGPGQTVVVVAGVSYKEQLVVTRSGEPGKPITFRGSAGSVGVRADPNNAKPAIVVKGAHDVVFDSLTAGGGVTVEASDRIGFNKVTASGAGDDPAVLITGGSHDVTYSRSTFSAQQGTPLVEIQGSSGTVLSRNRAFIPPSGAPLMVTATDAPRTTVTNNTIPTACGVVLSGDSTDSNVFNNVFAAPSPAGLCSGGQHAPVSVAASATAGTRVGYNLLNAATGTPLYSWGGTDYTDPEQFHAATGQGDQDLVVPQGHYPVGDMKAATDSADATAPGVLDTDAAGNKPADDPRVTNTGTGYGYLDRGAVEQQDYFSGLDATVDETWAPYGTTVTATAKPTDTWPAGLTYTFDFGDGTVVTTTSTSASHVYKAACRCNVAVSAVNGVGVTRAATPTAITVTEPGDLTPVLNLQDGVPGTSATPLTVTADGRGTTAPWRVTDVSYDFGDGTYTQGATSPDTRVSHTYHSPGDYTVTAVMTDAGGHRATATTTRHVAYLPSLYNAAKPVRLLDTRTGGDSPMPENSVRYLDISRALDMVGDPADHGAEAVVLNVTAVNSTADTFLTAYPSWQDRPTTSNLNVKAGQTVANLVTVPVGANGDVEIYNHSGSTDLVVDFVGYYRTDTGQKYGPVTPARLSDTTMAGDATHTLKVAGTAGVPADATAVVVNLTADAPTVDGYLTAYPHGIGRPTVSDLNFPKGRTVANQAIVPVGADGSIDVYNHVGNTRVVVDVFGYYGPGGKGRFTPTVPVRVRDTRSDGNHLPLGPNAWAAVPLAGSHGVPANATAAVLNVTAVAPTSPGYLTVWPDGTTRPGTSNLNLVPGAITPNHVTTPLGAGGGADVYNSAGSTHVVADLEGWFSDN